MLTVVVSINNGGNYASFGPFTRTPAARSVHVNDTPLQIRHATTVAALRDMQRLSISMDSGASTALGAGGLAGGHLETVLAQCEAAAPLFGTA